MTSASSPRAIAMWDFSWLERRWPGAGYEDWDQALTELTDRGYDTVRIDAYPHLVSADPDRRWTLHPQWNQNAWGAPSVVTVRVLPDLLDFIRAASRHGVAVALSTWFRQDAAQTRMRVHTAEDMGRIWVDTLRQIDRAGLLDAIVLVDLCNEFPLPVWAPFLYGTTSGRGLDNSHPRIGAWMRESVEALRADFPDLDYTYSMVGPYARTSGIDVSSLDVLEPHLWMADATDYYTTVGYAFEPYLFDPAGYDNVVARGRSTYLAEQERFDAELFAEIDRLADWSRATGKPLVTTEGWAIVDYKDWPGLDWDWVLDLNERAVTRAAATGRWIGLTTSNFCGPQFVGVWREVEHHRRLTDLIHRSAIDADLQVARS